MNKRREADLRQSAISEGGKELQIPRGRFVPAAGPQETGRLACGILSHPCDGVQRQVNLYPIRR